MITKYLIVFLISMVPLIELRGAIPYAVAFHGPAHWPQVSSIWTLRPAFSPSWAVFSSQASSCCLQVPAYSGQLGRFWRKRLCFRFNSIKFGLQPHRFVFPICAAVFV